MDTLAAIGRWLSKQHVVWCVSRDDELWCANAFYVYDPDSVAFYLLSDEHTRHGQMTGERAKVAGTVNGQPKTVALIRGVQFGARSADCAATKRRVCVSATSSASRWPACCRRRFGRFVRTKSSLPTTRWGSGKSYTGGAMPAPSRRSASRLKAGRSSGVLLVTSCSLSTTTSPGRKTRPRRFSHPPRSVLPP